LRQAGGGEMTRWGTWANQVVNGITSCSSSLEREGGEQGKSRNKRRRRKEILKGQSEGGWKARSSTGAERKKAKELKNVGPSQTKKSRGPDTQKKRKTSQ